MQLKHRASVLAGVCAVALGGVSGPAFAWEHEHPAPQKCNSGNGNGSEEITFVAGEHCFGGDPGKSFNAGNRGGDEYPTAGGVANPGGNNVP
jgi:hypothetical protein